MNKALVIGSNGTIGSAIVEALKSQGMDVSVITQSQTDYTEQSLKQHYDALKLEGTFSMIFCCIGTLHNDTVAPEKRLGQLNEQALSEYFRINTILPALCLRFFHRLLDKNEASKFVFLSAMVGSIEDNQLGGWYGYRSSKSALNMMVKTASIEIKRTNKKACLATIHPGTTKGPLSKPFAGGVSNEKYYTPQQSAQRIVALTENLKPDQTGLFFNWDGQRLPW